MVRNRLHELYSYTLMNRQCEQCLAGVRSGKYAAKQVLFQFAPLIMAHLATNVIIQLKSLRYTC